MKKIILKAGIVVLFYLPLFAGIVGAQKTAPTDARFEKLSKELYPKAQKEGALVVYTVWDVEHIRKILDDFSKRFPGIKTSYWQARNPEIVTRVITEYQAGGATVDDILSDNAPPVIRAAGAIMPYETVQEDALVMHDPTMPIVSIQVQSLVYNTKRLKAGDAPKNWEDVANPKYKGNVALDDPMRAGPLSSMLAGLKSLWNNDARFTKFVKGLKALNVPVHKSTSAMFRLVISGEYAIAMPALLHDVVAEIGKKTPITWVKSAPPIVFPRFAALYANAPHPNAAKLLAEWLITPEGQAALDSVDRETARRGFNAKSSVENNYPAGTKPIPVNDKLFLENPKKWLDTNLKSLWEG